MLYCFLQIIIINGDENMLCEELPTIIWFENDNPYSENENEFNYMIVPDLKEKKLIVKIWYGELCLELSETESEREFVLEERSMKSVTEYINSEYNLYINRMYGGNGNV